jgi:hypothetical protein
MQAVPAIKQPQASTGSPVPYNITCHELIHACSVHLRLSMWLNGGVDAVLVDRSAGGPTIRWKTLAFSKGFLYSGHRRHIGSRRAWD